MKKISIAIFLMLAISSFGQTSAKGNINLRSIVDNAANKMIEKSSINSVSIGILYQGKEFIGHYGELEKGKANKPTDKTVYEIGSVSKTFTGTLIAKAVLDNKLKLDDPIQKYLAEDYPNLKYNDQPITVKDLVTHTSGLPKMLSSQVNDILKDFTNEKTPEKINQIVINYSQKDFLRDLHSVKIDTLPGHHFSYSNVGIELLGNVLEKIYHKKYDDILKEYLGENIQMKNTKLYLSKKEEKDLAIGYHCDFKKITYQFPALPWGSSANVKSTLPDMMKYINYELKNNPEIAESHRQLVKFDDAFSSGYGWQIIEDEKLGMFYKHHGGVFRTQCFIYIIPKYNLGVFIITNQSGINTAKDMQDTLNEIFENIEQAK